MLLLNVTKKFEKRPQIGSNFSSPIWCFVFTNANVRGNATNVDIRDAFFAKLRSQLCLTEPGVVKETGVSIDIAAGALVNHNTVLGDLGAKKVVHISKIQP